MNFEGLYHRGPLIYKLLYFREYHLIISSPFKLCSLQIWIIHQCSNIEFCEDALLKT